VKKALEKPEVQLLVRKYALLNAIDHRGQSSAGAVIGRIMAEHPELRTDSKVVGGLARDVTAEVNRKGQQEQLELIEQEFPGFLEAESKRRKQVSDRDSEKKSVLPPLLDAKVGEVVTRFPPEPNGFMHIGHAKAAIFASEYAKAYSGKFIMRYDDTNPAAEKAEFYGAFLESFEWLGLKPDDVKYASDDMQRFYEIAEKMILDSKAYICFCSQEIMRNLRAKGEVCAHRLNTLEKNLESWKEMINGKYPENCATLRFAGDMQSQNTTMRDPVLFRVVLNDHPRQGSKYKVWPTYDFDGPIEDSVDGVTHAMRSKEYELRDELYFAILDSLMMRKPVIVEFSRLGLQNTTMSKRKLRKLVDEGLVDGWDDPRLPTISGLRRRGILPEAIRTFVISMGLSKVESQPTWDYLESINRKLLDPISPRYIFVPDPIALNIEGAPSLVVQLPYHPENESFGQRTIDATGQLVVPGEDVRHLAPGSKIRLIEAFNVKITDVSENEAFAIFDGDEQIRDIPKVQWLNASANNCELEVWIPGPLVFGEEFNKNSLTKISGLAEPSFAELAEGRIIQFLRFGFCRVDAPKVAILSCK
jgi:glutamyl-tRNA synthetase